MPAAPIVKGEPHLLVFRSDRIGDLVLTLPLAEAIKRAVPGARVTFCVQRGVAELTALCPFVDEVIPIEGRDLDRGDADFLAILKSRAPDIAIFAYPRPKLAFAAMRARIGTRVGTAYRWYSPLFTHRVREHRKNARKHERDYGLALLDAVGLPVFPPPLPRLELTPALRDKAAEFLAIHGLRPEDPFVVLHPGSGGSAKDWSARSFGIFASRLSEQKPELRFLVSGTKNESSLMHELCAEAPFAIPFASECSLPVLAAVFSSARLFIANSTGPLHIAAAVGVPVLGLYPFERPCNARRWGPLAESSRVLSPDPDPNCANCRSESCATHDQMSRISPESVMQAALSLLK